MGTTGGNRLSIIYCSLSQVSGRCSKKMKCNLSNSTGVWRVPMETMMQQVRTKTHPLPPTIWVSSGEKQTHSEAQMDPHPHVWSLSPHGAASPSPEVGRPKQQGSPMSCTQRSALARHSGLSEGHSSSLPSELPCLPGACIKTFTLSKCRFSPGWFYIFSRKPSS